MFAIKFTKHTTQVPQISKEFPPFDALTVCAWVKLTAGESNNGAHLFTFHTADSDEVFQLMFRPSQVTVYSYSQYFTHTIQPSNLFGTWTHFCVSMDTSRSLLYLNGTLIFDTFSTKMEFSRTASIMGTFTLGNDVDSGLVNNPDQSILGEVTKLYFFNKMLTQNDATNAYNNNLTPAMMADDVMVTWSEFKGLASGDDVIETCYPF